MIDIVLALALLVGVMWAGLASWKRVRGRPRRPLVLGGRTLLLLALLLPLEGKGLLLLMNSRRFQVLGEIVPRVEATDSIVALTIDDGPVPRTADFLQVLDGLGVRATFFVIGAGLAKDLESARQIVLAGHELGNHSYSHRRMIGRSLRFIRSELERTDSLIRAAGHSGDIHFRPPNLKKLVALPYYLARTGRKNIMVDVEPDSYIRRDPEAIVRHVLERTRPGSIIILHVFGVPASWEAVPGIVAGLRSRGYRFVTVSELLALSR